MEKKVEQSYVCLLRTLTRKSVFGFGFEDNKDLSMQQLLDSGRQQLMIKSYYTLGKITFTEDILNELCITEELRINKPGKVNYEDPIIKKALDAYYKDKDRLKEWQKAKGREVRGKRSVRISKIKKSSKIFSKSSLQLRNHGKVIKTF